jgi:hypothetical protein
MSSLLNADDLIEFVIENHVDLVLKLNLSEYNLKENLKQIKLSAYTETRLSESLISTNLLLQRHKCSLKVSICSFNCAIKLLSSIFRFHF